MPEELKELAAVWAGFADPPDAAPHAIDPDTVLDLTVHLGADGVLRWRAPPGEWRVLRFGASLTGVTNHPASPEATGLEVDRLDAEPVRRYFDTCLSLADPDPDSQEAPLDALLSDSIESGPQNWTCPQSTSACSPARRLPSRLSTGIRWTARCQPPSDSTTWVSTGSRTADVGVYVGHVDLDADFLAGRRILATFGDVCDIARVLVNGVDCGITWTAPFEADIITALCPGRNTVVVEVANAWMNRLTAEARHPTGEIFAPVADVYEPQAEIRPSGLSSPVVLRAYAP